MNGSKFLAKFLVGIILILFLGLALFLRAFLPSDKIFVGDWIKFSSNDAYYYMRLVDNLVHNFPHLTAFDPYLIYPGGVEISSPHLFFARLLASIIWIVGLGSPTEHTIDVVGVYFPAVLGALTVIPVYFIGKELFGRWAGLFSAGLITLLPGEFLGRSILGFTDHHVAETLFSTVTLLFLILAIKTASQRGLTFSHLKRRHWTTSAKPVIYSLLAGISLGVYLLTWAGGLLFIFIISVYFVIQFIIDHLKRKSTDYLCLVGGIFSFVAAIMSLLASLGTFFLVSIVIALLIPLLLNGISRLMASRKIKPVYYPLTLVGLGLAGLGLFYLINPSLLGRMLEAFRVFRPVGTELATIEMQPLLFPTGNFSLALAWGNFTTSFFLSLIALGILIYLVIKQGNAEKSLLVVWSLITLAATLGQRRFGYYFAVNVALLTGYLTWQILSLAGFKESATRVANIARGVGRKRARRKTAGFHITISQVNMALALLIIFLILYFPNIVPAVATASQARFVPNDGWCSALFWMRENTPNPFGNPDFYYHREESRKYLSLTSLKKVFPNPTGDPDFYYQLEASYKYPASAYGVTAWWDYGYWITRIARRIPNADPGQDPRAVTSVASFFTAQDEKSASEIARELGSAYIIIDYEAATSKFWAVVLWAGQEQTKYFEVYWVSQQNQLVPVQLFYPGYYQSLSTRLYNFDGQAVTPENVVVVSYEQKTDKKGAPFKLITGAQQFTSYEEAKAYILSQESANYKIVGNTPFSSPVPLEALEHYRLIYSSPSSVALPDGRKVPAVKIFEYLD